MNHKNSSDYKRSYTYSNKVLKNIDNGVELIVNFNGTAVSVGDTMTHTEPPYNYTGTMQQETRFYKRIR